MNEETRCTARRKNGVPCKNSAIRGGNVCRMHGGGAPQVRAAAQVRILRASDKAAARLVEMMQDPKVPFAVQLAAARDLLDRANVVGTQQIELKAEISTWEKNVGELIVTYPDVPEIDSAETDTEQDEGAVFTARLSEMPEAEQRAATRERKLAAPAPVRPPARTPTSAADERAPDWYDPNPLVSRLRPRKRKRT